MPAKTKTAQKTKRKYRKSIYKMADRYQLPSFTTPSVLPSSFKTTLRYAENITINNAVAGASQYHIFSATSLYDPNTTGIGHQPRFFDQLCSAVAAQRLYEHYTVIKSRCKVIFYNANGAATALCSIRLNGNNSGSTIKTDMLEGRHTKAIAVEPSNVSGRPRGVSAVYTPKFLGVKSPLSNTAIRGSYGSNPLENAYWVINVAAFDDAVAIGNVNCWVIIDYLAVFTEPHNPDES